MNTDDLLRAYTQQLEAENARLRDELEQVKHDYAQWLEDAWRRGVRQAGANKEMLPKDRPRA